MAQSGTPPPEAVRGGVSKTLFAVTVIIVAIVMLAAGVGLGNVLYGTRPPKANLVVGTNVPFPPFEDFNTSSGNFEGFDIDLAQLIATALGRNLVIRQFSDFQVLLATVGTGGVDMAASAITSSGATGTNRSRFMSFSDPYFDANQGVLVQTGSSLTCPSNTCTASNLAGLTVGVQQGTTSEAWLDANKDPSTTKVAFTTVESELAALRAGSIDAVMIDYGPAQSFAGAPGSGLRVAGQIITNELYSFAVPLGDPDRILPVINSLLAQIKTPSDGRYNALIAKWFG